MNTTLRKPITEDSHWMPAISVAELQQSEALLVRIDGKQVALFNTSRGIRACDNRCPHEGYPLSQGSLSADCILTCNWHNWKFNLDSGENLYGGDRLRTYPVELRGDQIWVDMRELPYAQRRATIEGSLRDAFDDHAYDRIGREIARLARLGDDPLDALRLTIEWSWQRMEFGWTHAYAGMADWLILYDEYRGNKELQLVCLLESVAHTAFDVLREPEYPFPKKITAFDETNFLDAIEAEDESTAVAALRGGLRDGLQFSDFEPALTRAALAHYNDFGHSLIYVTKAAQLIDRLGQQVAEPLLLSLTRSIIYARREDKIPEFHGYTTALAAWGKANDPLPGVEQWRKYGIDKSLKACVASSMQKPEAIYDRLLIVNAINLLSFDIAQQEKVKISVSGNVGWLDFTHGLTFANAVRKQCSRFPQLWPQGLLQMACFSGRNAGFTTPQYDLERWRLNDFERDIKSLTARILDHGQAEYIVSVHWLKLALAVREEIHELPTEAATYLAAALNRFINSPLKRRQARRTAHQSLQFVAKE
ncbi:MAG: Rieske (2Fe-2S) protein [Gammaproteobacteria bacterium]|nr:MAG: Rieske (2Fe-2S) protein [Gammaproteobacteria bacterium]